MTKTLGLIGTGMIGSALARLAVAADLDVFLSNSRGPDSLAELLAELGPKARAGTPSEAAQAGDLVVATIQLGRYRQLPVAALDGKIVIDTMNYYPDRDGPIAELEDGALTSSELVARHLPGSRVVKAFNNIEFRRLFLLARPTGAPDRSALPIAGDDAAATAQVSSLLDTLGYDAVNIGGLGQSWRSQPGTPVYVAPYLSERPAGMTEEESQQWFFSSPGVPVSAQRVQELIDSAVYGVVGHTRPTLQD